MSERWPIVRLAEVLEPVSRPTTPDVSRSYRLLGVRLDGNGAFYRETVTGAETSAAQLFEVKDGDFIYSRLFAWRGAFGLVGPDLAGSFVSSEFPTFRANNQRLDARFLKFWFRLPDILKRVEADCSGSTPLTRNRFKERFFLDLEIALPPLKAQRRIVARIEAISGKIEEARRLRGEAAEEAEALASSAASSVFKRLKNRVPLGDVCEVIDPNPSHRYPMYVPDGVPIVSSSEFVGEDAIDGSRAKRVPQSFFEDTLGRFKIQAGDVVFSRKGKVGYARPYPADQILAMTHTLCVLKPDRDKLHPRFLLHFSRSSLFIGALLSTMNPNVGVPTLGLGVIRGVTIPLPRLELQQRIADELEAVRALSSVVRGDRADSRYSLDALLPAVLDKAFRGRCRRAREGCAHRARTGVMGRNACLKADGQVDLGPIGPRAGRRPAVWRGKNPA